MFQFASFFIFQESAKKGHAAELLHHLPPGAKWDTAVKVWSWAHGTVVLNLELRDEVNNQCT